MDQTRYLECPFALRMTRASSQNGTFALRMTRASSRNAGKFYRTVKLSTKNLRFIHSSKQFVLLFHVGVFAGYLYKLIYDSVDFQVSEVLWILALWWHRLHHNYLITAKKVNCYWGCNNVHMQVLNVCFYSDHCSLYSVVSARQRTMRGHASQHSKRLQRQLSRMNRHSSPIPATSRELGG